MACAFAAGICTEQDRDLRDTHPPASLGLTERHNSVSPAPYRGLEQVPDDLVAMFTLLWGKAAPTGAQEHGAQLWEEDGTLRLLPYLGAWRSLGNLKESP